MNFEEKYIRLKEEFDQFAYIYSHDFKAPLRAISNLTDWISEDLVDNDNEDIKENLSLLKSRVDRLNKMVEATAKISRIERYDLKTEAFSPRSVVNIIADKLNITVENNLDTDEITGYKSKFEIVISEILKNAIEAKKDDLQVSMNSVIKDNYLVIDITDKGRGISKEVLPKVTDLFYTVQNKDACVGVGAGLYYISKILAFVGGEMSISSELGEQTTVTIKWPIK